MGLYNSKSLFDGLICRGLIYGGGGGAFTRGKLAISTFHVQQSKFCFCAKRQIENILLQSKLFSL